MQVSKPKDRQLIDCITLWMRKKKINERFTDKKRKRTNPILPLITKKILFRILALTRRTTRCPIAFLPDRCTRAKPTQILIRDDRPKRLFWKQPMMPQ